MFKAKKSEFYNRLILFLFLLLFSSKGEGQKRMLHSQTEPDSPAQVIFSDHALSSETDFRNAFLKNPALLHPMIEEDRHFFVENPSFRESEQRRVIVAGSVGKGKQKGDYLPYQGRDFMDYSIRANGYAKSRNATIYGKASFSAGSHKGYDWNALRYADLYWPYLVADSTGGNYKYETYMLMGAYSFQLKRWNVGVSGEYKGDFAYRQNDPRVENVTTWLTLKGGVAYATAGNIFSADITYTYHRQHMDLHHFRTGQFAGFFIEYGFGMFDYVHSPIFRSMKQQQHLSDYGISLGFYSDPKRSLRVNARLALTQTKISSEENVYKLKLYEANVPKIEWQSSILWNNNTWGVGCFLNFNTSKKKGQENVFERYASAVIDGVDVYDYKRIGTQKRYALTRMNGKADFKLSRFFPTATLSVLGGVDYFMRDETYKGKNFQIKNALITPLMGAELIYAHKSVEYLLKGTWGHRLSLTNTYRVGLELEKHTEFQHAFVPYAYYASTANVITIEATVSKKFAFGQVGLNAQLLLQRGDRLSDVRYDRDKYASANPRIDRPLISLEPDEHRTEFGRITLFTVF